MVHEDAAFVDGSVVRAHQHAAGARKDPDDDGQDPQEGGRKPQVVRIWDGREAGLVPRSISRWMDEADPGRSA
jgi:hypothetical protein